MMMSGRRSVISRTCRAVIPPDAGITVQPSRSAPCAETADEQAVAVRDVPECPLQTVQLQYGQLVRAECWDRCSSDAL